MRAVLFLVIVSFTTSLPATDKVPSKSSVVRPAQLGNGTTRFYKQNGASAGRAVTRGNTTQYYGPNGAQAGRSVQSGRSTKYYAPNGKLLGTSKK